MTMTSNRQEVETRGHAVDDGRNRSKIWMIVGGVAVLMLVVAGLFLLVRDDSVSEVDREADLLTELIADSEAELDVYYGESDPAPYVEKYADDITYFDPWADGKLEGRTVASEHLLAFTGTIPMVQYEIVNPDVELENDTAIFTFEIDVFDLDGVQLLTWNVTEVYRDAEGDREMIHAHFGVAGAAPEVEG